MIRPKGLTGVALFSLAAAGLALSACGGSSSDDNAPPKTVAAANNAAASSPAAKADSGSSGNAAAGGEVAVVLTENKFAPNDIKVKAGATVTFVARNQGQAVHNMKVLAQKEEGKDFTSAATIGPGTDSKFTATFSKKGTYKFQCDYHMPDMSGTITVE